MDFLSASLQLAAVERLDVADMELLVRLENSGVAFYDVLADRIGDEEAAVLLRRNGREEAGHARRVLRALELKVGEGYEAPPELSEPLQIDLPDPIDPAMLPLIVAGEIDGDAGYQGWADHEDDPEVARLLRLNGREETKHADRLREVMAILESRTP
ncbi:ferritin-like domain-containing protein [Rhabdothermincola salaria]|uniref:ferritin-like domain-containing protein n=1 Tax=Rhabdothermincola salaria TaxID=2903142 RepID=UPI001E2A96F7|nr:ferritin-like domain-containing protein [Rhabdothermincola salaria]MCD9625438.1 ferritin-like domain-containing protein [Rhabdothermincola salaria]